MSATSPLNSSVPRSDPSRHPEQGPSDGPAGAPNEADVNRAKMWRLRACCFAQIAGFGALLPVQAVWMKSAGLDELSIGILMAVGTAIQFVGGLFIGKWADQSLNPHRIQQLGAMVFAMGIALFGLSHNLFGIGSYMVLRGLGVATMTSVMPLLVVSVLGSRNAGSGYAWYRIFGSLGWIVATIGMSYLAKSWGLSDHLALRYVIVMAAVFTLISPLALWGFGLIGKTKYKTAHDKTVENKACDLNPPQLQQESAPAEVRIKANTKEPTKACVPVWRVFQNPKLLPVYAGVFLFAMGQPAIFEFLPLYAREVFNAPVTFLGLISGFNGVIAVVALPFAGFWIDRTGAKPWLLMALIAMPLRVIGSGLIPQDASYYLLLIPQLFHLFTWAGLEIAGVLYITQHALPGNRAVAVGAFFGAQEVGKFLGALMTGYVADHFGFKSMFYSVGVMSCLGLIVYVGLTWVLDRRELIKLHGDT